MQADELSVLYCDGKFWPKNLTVRSTTTGEIALFLVPGPTNPSKVTVDLYYSDASISSLSFAIKTQVSFKAAMAIRPEFLPSDRLVQGGKTGTVRCSLTSSTPYPVLRAHCSWSRSSSPRQPVCAAEARVTLRKKPEPALPTNLPARSSLHRVSVSASPAEGFALLTQGFPSQASSRSSFHVCGLTARPTTRGFLSLASRLLSRCKPSFDPAHACFRTGRPSLSFSQATPTSS